MKKVKPVIAVDFDGVIHAYSKGWQDGSIYDQPMPGVDHGLRTIIDQGYKLVVFTARANSSQGRSDVILWMDKHNLPYHDVTALKPLAVLYVDDRAIRFTNWTETMIAVERYGPIQNLA